MTLTKQDLGHIRDIVSESEKRVDIKIEAANQKQTDLIEKRISEINKVQTGHIEKRVEDVSKNQTKQLLDGIEGIADSVYGNFPTREEVKKGLKAFGESVTLKTS